MTRGAEFLDGCTTYGRALWLGMDEARGDAYPRLVEDAQARRDRCRVEDPSDPVAFLQAELDALPPDGVLLVVIDSLIEYARRSCREVPSSGDAAGWTRVVRPLTKMAHDYGVAIVTVHHSRRADGQYRDSGEIAAGVDAILTMLLPWPTQEDNVRRFELKGRRSITRRQSRWTARLVTCIEDVPVPPDRTVPPLTAGEKMPPLSVTTRECEVYEFGSEVREGGEEKIESIVRQMREVLARGPAVGKGKLRRQLKVKNNDFYAALQLMEKRGEIHIATKGNAQTITLVEDEDAE